MKWISGDLPEYAFSNRIIFVMNGSRRNLLFVIISLLVLACSSGGGVDFGDTDASDDAHSPIVADAEGCSSDVQCKGNRIC